MDFPSETGLRLILLLILGICAIVLKFVLDSRKAGLAHIPGPFLARYTDAWRLCHAVKEFGKQEYTSTRLMKTYGDVVRIGPTTVAVFDPAAIPTIYGTGVRLNKGDAFAPAGVTTNILTTVEEDMHAKYKKPVANAYSLSALKFYEPNVDRIISQLVSTLSEKAATSQVTNLNAYDVIGTLTFGQSLGFLETGRDLYGMVKVQKGATYYAAVASQMPWLDRLLKKTLGNHIGSEQAAVHGGPDLIAHFISSQDKYPDIMTDQQIGFLSGGNLFAGSQIPCSRYHMQFPPPLQQVQNLPYLDSVIREGYRLHGVGFFVLERVTPAAGLSLPSGHHLPAGIKVGIPSHGLSRRKDVFGGDADEFKPERWMRQHGESEDAFAKKRLAMERCDMTFGHGSRACIGKNIATMELYKAVATFVGLFKFDVVGGPKMFEVNVHVRKRSAEPL